jgi:hypothetical protein
MPNENGDAAEGGKRVDVGFGSSLTDPAFAVEPGAGTVGDERCRQRDAHSDETHLGGCQLHTRPSSPRQPGQSLVATVTTSSSGRQADKLR